MGGALAIGYGMLESLVDGTVQAALQKGGKVHATLGHKVLHSFHKSQL